MEKLIIDAHSHLWLNQDTVVNNQKCNKLYNFILIVNSTIVILSINTHIEHPLLIFELLFKISFVIFRKWIVDVRISTYIIRVPL